MGSTPVSDMKIYRPTLNNKATEIPNSPKDLTLKVKSDSPLLPSKGRRVSTLTIVETQRGSAEKSLVRAVLKTGECNISPTKIPKKRFIRDIFTTLVDLKWRWMMLIFTLGFFSSWTIFAMFWWLIALTHGDFEEHHLPMNQKLSNWTPCVMDIYGFHSCFLFSVETQHTTGYGQRTPTEQCFDATLLMCFQNIVGLIIEAFLVGIVFAKMTRPKMRTQTLKFSKFAVICQRESVLSLMFRVGDMRTKSRIIEAKIKTQLIRSKITREGESLGSFQTKLAVNVDDCDGDLFLIWPMTVVHKINEKSPFYKWSAKDFLQANFEIVVTLEGTIESTDQKTQARSSYVSSEVLWGHRFEPMMSVNIKKQGYKIDYSKFDVIYPIDTPLCSAAQLAEIYKAETKL